MADRQVGIEAQRFREVLAAYATGVTVITASESGEMVGMSANSFTSVSLDPPIVAFCAAQTSMTYPRIRRAGGFCVNILAADQAEVAKRFSRRGVERFAETPWHPAPSGAAILEGSLAWIDCRIVAEHPAGDHYLVLGSVEALEVDRGRSPLLYYRSSYGIEQPTVPLGESPPPYS